MVRCLSPNFPGCSIYPDKKPDQAKNDYLFTLQGEFNEHRRGWWRWASLALALLVLMSALGYIGARGWAPSDLTSILASWATTVPAMSQ
jgi:hypothetical protein